MSAEGLVFVIPSILKHSRRGSPASKVICVEWDAPELNVADYVLFYMDKTLKFHLQAWNKRKEDIKQLFLSHRTGRPVATASISRWLREVLSLSGVDISTFGPHSTRGASVSEATRRGATPSQILAHGNWSNLGCYQRFYNRDVMKRLSFYFDFRFSKPILLSSFCTERSTASQTLCPVL